MQIAVTGASGHIGNTLCRELVAAGHKVKVLVHEDPDDLDSLKVKMIHGNILEANTLDELCQGVDVVFHLAAIISISNKDKDKVYATNVTGTKNLVNSCIKQKVKKLVHFSSVHVLEPLPLDKELNEEREYMNMPQWVYENSKTEAEKIVLEAAKNGLHAVIVNPTAVVGPNDFKPSYFGEALLKIYKNKMPMLIPGGYDMVDVRDVVKGAIAASKKGRSGERYILSGRWISLKDLSVEISEISGKKTVQTMVPLFLAKIGVPFMAFFASLKKEEPLYNKNTLEILKLSHQNISSKKAEKELGYKSRSLVETLADTFEWFKQHGQL
ncbi:SDR family oxidoreductase [Desulfosarcina sp.]|nr:SDR family oxidoreductase [Desulfosarcina sp.]